MSSNIVIEGRCTKWNGTYAIVRAEEQLYHVEATKLPIVDMKKLEQLYPGESVQLRLDSQNRHIIFVRVIELYAYMSHTQATLQGLGHQGFNRQQIVEHTTEIRALFAQIHGERKKETWLRVFHAKAQNRLMLAVDPLTQAMGTEAIYLMEKVRGYFEKQPDAQIFQVERVQKILRALKLLWRRVTSVNPRTDQTSQLQAFKEELHGYMRRLGEIIANARDTQVSRRRSKVKQEQLRQRYQRMFDRIAIWAQENMNITL